MCGREYEMRYRPIGKEVDGSDDFDPAIELHDGMGVCACGESVAAHACAPFCNDVFFFVPSRMGAGCFGSIACTRPDGDAAKLYTQSICRR
jgi:hypothetical protein